MNIIDKAGRKSRVALLLIGLAALGACSKEKPAQKGPAAVPVVVAKAEQRSMPVEINAIGAVEPYSTVQVKTQVTGQLTGVYFKEGDYVKKGQLLFTLDTRQMQADLQKLEGQLARDQASLANAKAQQARYDALLKAGVISREQAEQQDTQAQTFEAAVQADKAAIDSQKVQITYAKIYSPIDGRTGNLIVHEGNMVKANDTMALVVINKVQPIYVTFSVPEKELAEIKQHSDKKPLAVQASIAGDPKPAVGKLSFIDNAVDTATGTIKLKGEFKNSDHRLWPGSFADVSLTLADDPNAVVVPSSAVQNGQQGQFVFVVKNDRTAEMRPVTVDRSNDKVSVIKNGLQPGETVVTDGQVRVAPGAKLDITNQPVSASQQEAPNQGSGS